MKLFCFVWQVCIFSARCGAFVVDTEFETGRFFFQSLKTPLCYLLPDLFYESHDTRDNDKGAISLNRQRHYMYGCFLHYFTELKQVQLTLLYLHPKIPSVHLKPQEVPTEIQQRCGNPKIHSACLKPQEVPTEIQRRCGNYWAWRVKLQIDDINW